MSLSELPAGLQSAVLRAFADTVVADASLLAGMIPVDIPIPSHSLRDVTIAQLPGPLQSALWRFLDEIGYFLDETRRAEVLDGRLGDLGDEVLEEVRRAFVRQIDGEVGSKPVADLSEELRQALREAVEAQGYFESRTAQARALEQPLGTLSRTDLDAVALEIGLHRLTTWASLSVPELPRPDQELLLAYIRMQDWFLDSVKLEQLPALRLRDSADLQDLAEILHQEQIERLRRQSLGDLPSGQRQLAYEILYDLGVRSDESQLRSIRSRTLASIEPEVYQDLLRFLGSSVAQEVSQTRARDLDPRSQALLSLHLGRRIMSRVQRRVLLDAISRLWIDYLTDIEDLRRGIGLEAYGQRDPLVEYKRKAYELFEQLTENIRRTVVRSLFRQAAVPLED